MEMEKIRNSADGTEYTLCGFTMVKTADGLYCKGNGHLYTWWNVEASHLNKRLILKTI